MNPTGQPPELPPGLYALCDDGFRPEVPLGLKARALLEGGVRVLQLRMKRTPVREALQAAREIAALCRAAGTVCLLNDRVDLALLSGADGVHVGDEDLRPEDARAVLGPRAIVGVTVRDAGMARAAAAAGATYVGAGPVFGTTSKQVAAPVMGVAGLAALVRESPLPVVGIGGIGGSNIAAVAGTGAHGAAVLSELLAAEDVAARARTLRDAFQKGRAQ